MLNFLIGYNKVKFQEKFSEKNLIKILDDFKNISFKLINSGISVDINFVQKINEDSISGILKSKILNNNLKFNFDYDNKKIKIYNSFFRSKELSFTNEALIVLEPFWDIKSKFHIENIDMEIFEKLDLYHLLKSKRVIKKINSKNEFSIKPKKFRNNYVDEIFLKIDLAYGRINYLKKSSLSNNVFLCEGNINLLEEFPQLFFDCDLIIRDKKKLFKQLSIKNKNKNFDILVKGNLGILNKKINFKNISINENYKASKEDLIYFKETFENIILRDNITNMFKLKNIKKFITEIN